MRRRGKVLGEASCPTLTINTTTTGIETTFKAVDPDGRVRGYVETHRRGKALIVNMIRVADTARRCGVGTKLYEAAAAWGCGKGLLLRSDELRSSYSDGFWRKQVSKGRARCAKKDPFEYMGVDAQLPIRGRSGCAYYKLKSCEVAKDLSGSLRRRRRR